MTNSWNNKFLLDIPELDQQHQKFFEIFDAITKEANADSPEKMESIIIELEKYLEYHFQTEERLMKEAGYQGLNDHIAQHKQFISRINEMKLELDYMNPMLFDKITVFIKKWFIVHILQSDYEYKEEVGKYIGKND